RAMTGSLQLRARELEYRHRGERSPAVAEPRSRRGWRATRFMARPRTSILRRLLVQTDCAFWCIHDHLDVLAFLGFPTLAGPRRPARQRGGAGCDLGDLGLPHRGGCLDRGCALPVPGTVHLHGAAAALRGLRLEGGRWRGGHGRRVLLLVPAPRRPAGGSPDP